MENARTCIRLELLHSTTRLRVNRLWLTLESGEQIIILMNDIHMRLSFIIFYSKSRFSSSLYLRIIFLCILTRFSKNFFSLRHCVVQNLLKLLKAVRIRGNMLRIYFFPQSHSFYRCVKLLCLLCPSFSFSRYCISSIYSMPPFVGIQSRR